MATLLVGLLVGIQMKSARAELIYCGIGIIVFIIGRLVQGKDPG